ncbi:MAG TPA: hypothetical protein VN361_03970 [Oxalicibacterium sp.]|nr:hypothetical protein [Oxalicibacterium sp.]
MSAHKPAGSRILYGDCDKLMGCDWRRVVALQRMIGCLAFLIDFATQACDHLPAPSFRTVRIFPRFDVSAIFLFFGIRALRVDTGAAAIRVRISARRARYAGADRASHPLLADV